MLLVAGTINDKMAPVLKKIYDQMAEPKWVISMGACACSGGFYRAYHVMQGIDEIIPVDVYVPGCPPTPEGLIYGILQLKERVIRDRKKCAALPGARPNRKGQDQKETAACPTLAPPPEQPRPLESRARTPCAPSSRPAASCPQEGARPADLDRQPRGPRRPRPRAEGRPRHAVRHAARPLRRRLSRTARSASRPSTTSTRSRAARACASRCRSPRTTPSCPR